MAAASSKQAATKAAKAFASSVAGRLLDGLNVKHRADGTVHTVRGPDGSSTVAEVCVGSSRTRLNFRTAPTGAQRGTVTLDGRSKSWAGGGVVVTDANLTAARRLLVAVASGKAPAKAKAKAPAKAKATADLPAPVASGGPTVTTTTTADAPVAS